MWIMNFVGPCQESIFLCRQLQVLDAVLLCETTLAFCASSML